VTYPSQYSGYAGWTVAGNPHYALVVDPYLPCRAYRIGTPGHVSTDRNVVQRSLDSGRTWHTVLRRPDGFEGTRLYVPAPGTVLLAEDGDGTSLLRSGDGGTTWHAARGDLPPGVSIHSLGFAPGDARTLYAVALTCDTTGSCADPNLDNGEDYVGTVALWRTTDGGAHWTASRFPDQDKARSVFKVALRAGHTDEPYVYDNLNGVALHGQRGRVLTSADGGLSFIDAGNAPPALFDQFTVGSAGDGRPLLVLHDNVTGADVASLDRGATWSSQQKLWGTDRTAVAILPGGRTVTVGGARFGSSGEGTEMRAVLSPDAFRSFTVSGTTPPVPPYYGYVAGDVQVASDGDVYVSYAVLCWTDQTWAGPAERCHPGAPADRNRYRWLTVRYRPPAHLPPLARPEDPGTAPARCVDPTCALTAARAACTLDGVTRGSGLAFDGARLLYATRAAYGTRIHRLDPATCRETSAVDVALDPRAAVAATRRTHTVQPGKPPSLLPTLAVTDPRPEVDALAYDAARDTLWLSLADTSGPGMVAEGNPASVWSARLGSPRPVARLAFSSGRCLPHRRLGSGIELLAWDRDDARLVTCQQARPAAVDARGTPAVQPCLYGAAFRGYGYGWPVTSWTDAGDRTALLLVNAGTPPTGATLVHYDLSSCTAIETYGADAIGAAKAAANPDSGGNPAPDVMTQLACDPVTFAPRVAVWQRAGATLTPYLLPASSQAGCPVPTTTAVAVRGGRACASLAAAGGGPGRALAALPLRVRAGATVATVTTDAYGTACLAGRVRGDVTLRADFAGSGPYLPSAATRAVAVPRVPPRRAPVIPPLPPRPVPRPHVPEPAEPAAAAAPVAAPAVPPAPPPVPGAQAPVGGLSEEQEQQRQLATVSQDAGDEQAGEELLAAALLTALAAGYATWQRRTSVVRAGR
jgi:hypothetical protein